MRRFTICISVLGIISSIITIGLAVISEPIWIGIGNAIIILYCLYILIGSILCIKEERLG